MTPGTLRAYIVVLSFEPPGPVHVNTWLALDPACASALATLHFMRTAPTEANLMACIALEMPADQLRHLLRAVEGRLPDSGNAEIVSLVPRETEADVAESLRKHMGLDAADASTFTGANVNRMWEQFGPPMPPGAA